MPAQAFFRSSLQLNTSGISMVQALPKRTVGPHLDARKRTSQNAIVRLPFPQLRYRLTISPLTSV